MEDLTCPNCNLDTDREELRRSNGHCPNCGYDFSDVKEVEPLDEETGEEEDWEDDEEQDEETEKK